MKITGKTIQLGVIGDPISHSFSPQIHNFISAYTDNDISYAPYLVKPENLADAIAGIKALNIRGINVTAPHKIEVMKYLDKISPEAKILGSVNTVVNDNGILTGYNTDSEGFYLSLERAGIVVCGKNILVMGCGGVVIPALVRIIKENPKSITLLNRTPSKAKVLADKILQITGFEVNTDLKTTDFDIIINTTCAGMEHMIDVLPWESITELCGVDFIKPGSVAVDMIYNPAQTKFLKLAQDKGARILNGLDMLIYQAVLAYELFADTKLDKDITSHIRKEVFGL